MENSALRHSSNIVSGFNTTLIFKTHPGTIPSQPALGRALSALEVEVPAPKLRAPIDDDDGDDDNDEEGGPHFIKDATVLSALLETTSS
jgi:hypothetical protein